LLNPASPLVASRTTRIFDELTFTILLRLPNWTLLIYPIQTWGRAGFSSTNSPLNTAHSIFSAIQSRLLPQKLELEVLGHSLTHYFITTVAGQSTARPLRLLKAGAGSTEL
jgi:hypothetical protein